MRGAHLVRGHLRLLELISTVVHALRLLAGGWLRRMRWHHLHHPCGSVHPRTRSVLRVAPHHLSSGCCGVLVDNGLDLEDLLVVAWRLGLEQPSARLGDNAWSWLSRTMRVEILREIVHATLFHHCLQRIKVRKVRILPLFELPNECIVRWDQFLNHIVVVVNLQQVVDHQLVIRHVCIVQRLNVIEYLLDLLDAFGRSDPQFALRTLEALRLDVLDLHDREISLLSPLELLVQKVEHREVQTPHVVTSGQIDIVVRIEAGKRYRAPKIRIFALRDGVVVSIQVLLGQAEVHDENSAILAIQNKIGRLDITMDKTALVHFFH